MNILEKILNRIALFFYGTIKFIIMIVKSLITLRAYFDLIGGILFQPIIFFIALIILKPSIENIESVYYDPQDSIFSYIILLVILLAIIVLVINSLIELIYYLLRIHDRYNIVFSIQKGFYNYSLIVISLIAFWVAYDQTIDGSANLELLFSGILFFGCVIITDLYNFLIHSQDKVGKLYNDIIQKKEEWFG